jgi:hypothetical protein
MKNKIIRIDIEKKRKEVFEYKKYREDNMLVFLIVEDGKIVDMKNYKGKVLFLLKDKIVEKDCQIENNQIKVLFYNDVILEKGIIPFEIVLEGNEQIVTTFRMFLKI